LSDAIIPIAVPDLGGNERKYLNECIESNFVSTVGPFVERFEQSLAEVCGAPRAVATMTGTAGLHLALLAVGVQPDNVVIAPSLSFIASANAISYCGAKAWFLDVDAESWTLDARLLHETLAAGTEITSQGACIHRRSNRRVAAIMPVCTLGEPPDMDEIVRTANEFSIPVVVDAAPALGATYKNGPVGNAGADLTVYSFNGNKTVTTGGGGAVVGEQSELLDKVYHLSTTARTGRDYDHDEIGYNYRMTNLQAAVGCAQLERLDEFVQSKRSVREQYNSAIDNLDGIEAFPQVGWGEGTAWLSGFTLTPSSTSSAAEYCDLLRQQKIDARPIWKPSHLQNPYTAALCAPLAVTETVWRKIVTLPSSVGITGEELENVLAALSHVTKTLNQGG